MELSEIENGETRTLEFKKELPQDSSKWIKTIVAFANGAGGKLLIGVSNKTEVVGIPKDTDIFSLRDKISDTIAQMCEPQIMFDIYQESVEDKVLIVVEVFPGNDTPYFIKSIGKENGTFIRLNATTRNADFTTLDELELRKKRRYYDELPMTELEVTDSDIEYLCSEFSKRAGTKITKESLLNMHLIQKIENNLVATKAYAIFLGKHDYLSRIQCARFKGTDRVHFIDKKDFSGPLLEQIDGAYKFVLEHINMAIEINGIVHDEIYELPTQAIRELIVNAAIHRNYMMNSSVQVAVYDDRVEISSPRSLYGSLTLEEAISGRSSIRNKVLASVCEKLNVIEGWGTGLKRIIDFCKEKNVNPPVFEEIGDLLRVNFYRPSYKETEEKPMINDPVEQNSNGNQESSQENENVTQKTTQKAENTTQKTTQKVENTTQKIIEAIKTNPSITREELSVICGISSDGVKYHLTNMKKNGIIRRVGADKGGHWEVVGERNLDIRS